MTRHSEARDHCRNRALLFALSAFWAVAACGGPMTGSAGNAPPAQSKGGLSAPLRHPHMPARELFDRGLALAKAGQLVRAEQYVSLAVASGYPQERALPVLIGVCLSSSRLRAALNYAEPYLTHHPDAWALRHLVAAIYAALGQPKRARGELEKVVRDHPSYAPAHYLLAVTLRDEYRDVVATRHSFKAYLRHSPDGEHAAEARAWLREHALENGHKRQGRTDIRHKTSRGVP